MVRYYSRITGLCSSTNLDPPIEKDRSSTHCSRSSFNRQATCGDFSFESGDILSRPGPWSANRYTRLSDWIPGNALTGTLTELAYPGGRALTTLGIVLRPTSYFDKPVGRGHLNSPSFLLRNDASNVITWEMAKREPRLPHCRHGRNGMNAVAGSGLPHVTGRDQLR